MSSNSPYVIMKYNSTTALALLAATLVGHPAFSEETSSEPAANAHETAVALNYCRAAFHRIRKDPSDEVLREEQEKILNNLNLARLEESEVVRLYTSVLEEIGQIGIADKERNLHVDRHNSSVRRKLTWDAVAFGTDLMTAQFGSAIRTGANSWWDYRTAVYERDSKLLKVNSDRINAVIKKSSQFLDTFWKLAREKNIPDRWLVRHDDLDALEAAMREPDPEVRLRILRRMEPFMEAYPPYWYYVGKTQQELGELAVAMDTYIRLEQMAAGHFRKDDMLATALANRAAIAEFLGDATAVASAKKALSYSTAVWEANLMCARILERHGQIADAEDAILRNLDVDLETAQSRVFLVSLYYHSDNRGKLAKVLEDREAVAELPAPVLLRCAAKLGPAATPPHVIATVMSSLDVQPRQLFGSDDLVVRAASSWQLHLAQMRVMYQGNQLQRQQVLTGPGYHDIRFAGAFDWGNPLTRSSDKDLRFTLELTYPDNTSVRVALEPGASGKATTSSFRTGGGGHGQTLRIAQIQVDDEGVMPTNASLSTTTRPAGAESVPMEETVTTSKIPFPDDSLEPIEP